jgi:hypothetical protein
VDLDGYLRVYRQVVSSGEAEVYLGARDESGLVWSGGIFRLFRAHLCAHYRLDRVQDGWEVWTRLPDGTAATGR